MRTQVRDFIDYLLDTARKPLQPLAPARHSERTKALFAVGLVSFLWGTTWLASKRGVSYMPALQLSGIRQLAGGSLYILYFSLKGYRWPTRSQLLRLTWMSILMFVMSNGLSTWSVQYIPSGLGAVIGAITPIWIAVFSLFLFKDTRMNLMTTTGLLLGFGGILVIFSDYLEALFNSDFLLGILMGIVATMTWALGTLLTVKHAKEFDPYYGIGWQMFLSGVILTGVAWATSQRIPLAEIPTVSWYSIAYLVVVGSIITFAAFIYSLKRLPAAQASVYAYINPIVAVAIGSLMNDERLNLVIAGGTAVTLMGVYLVNTGFKKSGS
jgi:drug/metabolite transporter (DMT)-like permease